MRLLIYSLLLLCSFHLINAQNGHEIKIKIDGFQENVLYLAYHYGSKQYIADTAYRGTDGVFTFTHESEPLEPGLYMVVMPPDNSNFELVIDKKKQFFSLSTNVDNPVGGASFSQGASDNQLFYEYLNFLNTQRERMAKLDSGGDTSDQNKASIKNTIDKKVNDYQTQIIEEYPETMTALVIKANLAVDYTSVEDKSQESLWRYTQAHWFDNIDLSDDRMLRTPFLEQKVEYFLDKLHVQNPEDIISAIDKVLGVMDQKGENFKFFTIHFLNKYARSKTVGMDAVYVHIAQAYYAKGLAPWTESSQLTKIIENASRLAPLLIGEIAPDLPLRTRDGFKVNLHDLESEFTILYFWRPDCEHCKKTAPVLQEFFEAYRDKGVKIAAICTKVQAETEKCWAYVDENNYNEWIHLADSDQKSNMTEIYDIRATPVIYVLDRDKKIISKRIGADQLKEVIDFALRK